MEQESTGAKIEVKRRRNHMNAMAEKDQRENKPRRTQDFQRARGPGTGKAVWSKPGSF